MPYTATLITGEKFPVSEVHQSTVYCTTNFQNSPIMFSVALLKDRQTHTHRQTDRQTHRDQQTESIT